MLRPAARVRLALCCSARYLQAAWGGNIAGGRWRSRGPSFRCAKSLQQPRFCSVSLGYLRAFSEDWNAQIHSREAGLEGKIPTAVRGPDKHKRTSLCNRSPHYRYKNLTLAPDKKNGSAEDLRTHKVLQNAAITLAVIPEIGRLRFLLHFVGQILTLALSYDRRRRAFRQTMPAFFEERKL